MSVQPQSVVEMMTGVAKRQAVVNKALELLQILRSGTAEVNAQLPFTLGGSRSRPSEPDGASLQRSRVLQQLLTSNGSNQSSSTSQKKTRKKRVPILELNPEPWRKFLSFVCLPTEYESTNFDVFDFTES